MNQTYYKLPSGLITHDPEKCVQEWKHLLDDVSYFMSVAAPYQYISDGIIENEFIKEELSNANGDIIFTPKRVKNISVNILLSIQTVYNYLYTPIV